MSVADDPRLQDEPAPPGVSIADWEEFNRRNWMTKVRRYARTYWPYERLLPSDEPVYVTKLFYMFGSIALMSFVSLIVTGCILVFKGPLWWHGSSWGNFFNALHFWSVQLFFFSIFVHVGSSFFTAAWRGGRGLTWVFGAMTFLVAILTGLTGYVAQSNFDGQYIGQQAKDATNAVGLGYVLNLMSFDNVIGWHVVILPLGVAAFLALHLLWVRRHGIVAPFPPEGVSWQGAPEPGGPTSNERSSSTHAGYDGRAR
jgi:ubiquinol-cytochrome c reductase cytochrome b subunit